MWSPCLHDVLGVLTWSFYNGRTPLDADTQLNVYGVVAAGSGRHHTREIASRVRHLDERLT